MQASKHGMQDCAQRIGCCSFCVSCFSTDSVNHAWLSKTVCTTHQMSQVLCILSLYQQYKSHMISTAHKTVCTTHRMLQVLCILSLYQQCKSHMISTAHKTVCITHRMSQVLCILSLLGQCRSRMIKHGTQNCVHNTPDVAGPVYLVSLRAV